MKKDTWRARDLFKKIDKVIRIQQIGCFFDRYFEEDFDFQGEFHNFVELVYVASGSVEVVENGKVYEMEAGEMILHAPMEFHRIKSAKGTTPRVINLSFTTAKEMPTTLFDGKFHLDMKQREQLTQNMELARRFLQEETSDIPGQRVADALSVLLLDIWKKSPVDRSISTESSALVYDKLVSDMQNAIYENITIEQIAQQNFISVSYVKKLFQTYADMAPKQFYNSLRVKLANDLLDNNIPITEIAVRMNFSSPNYFSLFYKKQTGLTPSEYRKHRMDY